LQLQIVLHFAGIHFVHPVRFLVRFRVPAGGSLPSAILLPLYRERMPLNTPAPPLNACKKEKSRTKSPFRFSRKDFVQLALPIGLQLTMRTKSSSVCRCIRQ